jgi:endonuclease YncB( thermonuclease family)
MPKRSSAKIKIPKYRIFLDILLVVCILIIGFLLLDVWNKSLVVAVPDGDSIDLKDGRRVRLLGLDAPEIGRCGSIEAKNRLSQLTLGKHVMLKNLIKDDYGRILADVFIIKPFEIVGDGWQKVFAKTGLSEDKPANFINMTMISEGLAKYEFTDKKYAQILTQAYQNAKDQGLGIYSSVCRQSVPSDGRVIKGNIREGKKYYYPPTCKYYFQVIVDTGYGDLWFKTIKEAKGSGFILAPSCQ